MSASSFPFVPVITRTLQRLQDTLSSKAQLDYLLTQLGWDSDIDAAMLLDISRAVGLGKHLDNIRALAEDLRHERGDVAALASNLFDDIKALFATIEKLQDTVTSPAIAPFNLPGFWPALAQDLVPYLLTRELKTASPIAYATLLVVGVIKEEEMNPTAAERLPYTRITLCWQAIGDFLSSPVGTLATRYGWGTGQVLDYHLVLQELVHIASLFPVAPRLSAAPVAIADKYYDNNAVLEQQQIASFILPFVSGMLPDRSGAVELGLSLTPIPTVPKSGAKPSGFLLAPYLHGSLEQHIPLRSDLLLSFKEGFASDNAVGVEVLPGTIRLESDPGSTAVGAEISLVASPAEPLRLFGTDATSRLELTGYALSVGVEGTIASPELLVRAGTGLDGGPGRLVLYLEPGDGDSFIATAFGPDPVKLQINGALTWSSQTGLGIDGSANLHIRRAPNKTIGPLTLHDYSIDIAGQANHPLVAAVALGTSLKLGPVTATIEQIGVEFRLSMYANGNKGLLDNIDVSWGFKAPTGIGIAVDSDLVTGGGYLFLDPANHRYAGAASLTLKTSARDINLNALGLLQTQLPGKPDEYSLLLLITAQFSPIDLGLGFTLNGLGGLVGVNRAASTDYLRGLVREGQTRKLLFPASVLDDPAGALAIVDAAFPATDGRYVIGLLGELGWGTPKNLIVLDVALLLEFPAPLRVLLLGVLQVVLPDEQADTLKLRADFLGFVDFGAKKASFDASLSDSHILSFALTGDMAFRLYQGSNPLFLITAGGFHPAFQPPAGAALPALRRLTLSLNKGDELQLTLASYFAVTSNTVQFGAHLDLFARICHGLSVEGHFGLDVLFQFQPFRLLAHIEAGVAIKSGSHELLSVHLALDVTGPGPWHLWGEASFRVLFFKISFDVNATIGDAAAAAAPLPAPNVHEQLVAALQDPASWTVEAPTTTVRPGGVTLRPADAAAGQLFLDPRGALTVRQRVAPLGVKLEKFGSSRVAPVGGQFFEVTGFLLKDDFIDGSGVEGSKDFFAPDQYRVLTDAQKLSLPSFQSLSNGLRLKRLAGLKAAGKATRRIVEYEKKMLGGLPAGATPKVQPASDTFQQLAKGSTLGRATQAEQPSARAPKPITWTEDTYEVVHVADLSYYDATHQAFGSQVEAEQYRQTLAGATELVVVPSYQLALA